MTSLDHPALVTWTTAADYEDIRYEHSGDGIAKITINRPHVRNAFRPQTLMEISDALIDAREDGSVGAIILTGEGPDAFCSGGDQNVRGDTGYLTEPGQKGSVGRFHVTDLQIQIRRLPKPVIAMVAGYAIGGGHILHLVCDLTIAADNANIYRLVSVNGTTQFRQFNYDNYSLALKLIPRATTPLDYNPVDPDDQPIGNGDLMHGEAGDDSMHGMTGHDTMFAEGQDDDVIGGVGNDWISGGTGQDGVLGDDGRIATSRNGSTEPLSGVNTATSASFISTPGKIQQADIHVNGTLKKVVNLTPFSTDPDWAGLDNEFADGSYNHTSDDLIYGGWGDDSLHGGSGDDAISGADPAYGWLASLSSEFQTRWRVANSSVGPSCSAGARPGHGPFRSILKHLIFNALSYHRAHAGYETLPPLP